MALNSLNSATPVGKTKSGSLAHYLPFLNWLVNYRREDLVGDMMAGLIVTIMLVPQGMAYALLAGLPPEVGLYASIVPLIIYGLLGTSRTLAVGPVAIVSLLVATGDFGTYVDPVLVQALGVRKGAVEFVPHAAALGAARWATGKS